MNLQQNNKYVQTYFENNIKYYGISRKIYCLTKNDVQDTFKYSLSLQWMNFLFWIHNDPLSTLKEADDKEVIFQYY